MKKIRVFLAMSALLLAIGGALASNYVDFTYYELQVIEDEKVCQPREVSFECFTVGTVMCATAAAPSIQLRRDNSPSTSCGPELWKQ